MGPALLLAVLAMLSACGSDGSGPSATDETGTIVLGATATFSPEMPPTVWRGRITGGGIDLTLEGSTPGLTSPALPAGSYTVSLTGIAQEGVVLYGERQGVSVAPGTPTSLVLELGSYIPRPLAPASPLLAGTPVTLRWDPVPGASGGYDVEVGPDPSFATAVDRNSTQEAAFPVVFSTPGSRFFRVRARPNPRVSVSGAWSANTPTTRLEVEAPPVVELSVARVTMEARVGDLSSSGAVVEVLNGGGGSLGPLVVAVSHATVAPVDWLEAFVEEGAAPRLVLTARPDGLSEGLYRATVQVAAGGAGDGGSTAVLEVEFVIRPASATASLGVEPGAVAFLVGAGGEAPSPRVVQVVNTGSGVLEGLAVQVMGPGGGSPGWLTAMLDRTSAPATLSLAASPAGIPEGVHEAHVAISANGAGNSPVLLPVTLTVAGAAAPPAIDLSASTVAFPVVEGGDAPPPQTVRVRNGGGGVLSGLTTRVDYAPGEPTGWLAAGLNATTALATLTLSASPAGLPVGTYMARVQVDSDVAEAPADVTVTLSVTPVPMATVTVYRGSSGGTGNVGVSLADTLLFRGIGADSAQRVFPVGTELTVTVLDSVGWRATLTAEGRPECQGVVECTVRLDGDLRVRALGFYSEVAYMWELNGGGRVRGDRVSEGARWLGSRPAYTGWAQFVPVNSFLRIEAVPDPGWRFQRWGGPCTHAEPVCEFLLRPTDVLLVQAHFEPIPPSTWPRFDGPRRFEFTVPVGSTATAVQTQTFNGSDLSIHPVTRWQDTGADWSTVEVNETGVSGVVTVNVDPTGLAAGTWERTVTFVSWKAEDTRMDVVVVLRVVP